MVLDVVKGERIMLTDIWSQTFVGNVKSVNWKLGRVVLKDIIQLPRTQVSGYRNFDLCDIVEVKKVDGDCPGKYFDAVSKPKEHPAFKLLTNGGEKKPEGKKTEINHLKYRYPKINEPNKTEAKIPDPKITVPDIEKLKISESKVSDTEVADSNITESTLDIGKPNFTEVKTEPDLLIEPNVAEQKKPETRTTESVLSKIKLEAGVKEAKVEPQSPGPESPVPESPISESPVPATPEPEFSEPEFSESSMNAPLFRQPVIMENRMTEIKKFDQEYYYIQGYDMNYQSAIGIIKTAPKIAIYPKDTSKGRMQRASIMAISTSKNIFVFDLHTLGDGVLERGLKEILESKEIIKVVYDARLLSDCLKYKHLINLENVRDVEAEDILIVFQERRQVRKHTRSLEYLIKVYLGVEMQGCRESGDVWNERPIPPHLLDILISRVGFLLPLQDAIEKKYFQKLIGISNVYNSSMRSKDLYDFLLGNQKVTLQKDLQKFLAPNLRPRGEYRCQDSS